MDETNVYASLSDIPRPDALISTYNARVAILRGYMSGHIPNGLWPTMNEQAADIIDRTERTLELLRLDIRAFRNSTIPLIARLPQEVLAMIFEIAACDPDNTPHPPVDTKELKKVDTLMNYSTLGILRDRHVREDIFQPGSIGWIQLGHVCRQWRTILHGMQAIWAQILGRLPSGDEDILMRAGEHAPLDIFTTCTPFNLEDQRILELLASWILESPADSHVLLYADRLRRVCLVDLTPAGNFRMPVEWLTSPSFPNLDTLEIALQHDHGVASVQLSARALVVPRLRVMRLQGCYIPWQSFMLERLSLHWIDHEALPAHTLFEILAQASPTLQYLEMWYAFRLNDDGAHGYSGQVILPRLRLLSISENSGQLSAFLGVVKLPLGVHIHVYIYIEAEPDWLETDDSSVEEARNAVQADIAAALYGGHFESSLDGLIISQGDDIEAFDEIYLHMYGGSLDHMQRCINADASDPFDISDASLGLLVENGGVGSDIDPPLLVCLSAMTRFLNPKRFSTISIDMPRWDMAQIALGMSVFTELRALRVVNPLHYLDFTPPTVLHSHVYTAFPFLNGLSQFSWSLDNDRRNPSPGLDVLWLVQQDYEEDYEEHTYSSWCETIAYQLALTLCDRRPVAGAKPIGVLRIDYVPTIRDEERNAHEIFAEIADVVKWSSRENGAEG